jgi:hypothetical protein
VVQVGVGQDDGVDLVRAPPAGVPVAQAQLLVALEQPAVDQQAVAVVPDQVSEPVTVPAPPRKVMLTLMALLHERQWTSSAQPGRPVARSRPRDAGLRW